MDEYYRRHAKSVQYYELETVADMFHWYDSTVDLNQDIAVAGAVDLAVISTPKHGKVAYEEQKTDLRAQGSRSQRP